MENVSNGKQRSTSHVVLTVVGIVLCCILIPMLVLNLTIIIKGTVNPDTPPAIFGVIPLAVLSGSMEPEIEIGDMIFVKSVDVSTLKVQDVITFKDGESYVTHRIIEVVTNEEGETLYRTRGDNNNTEDRKLVSPETVIGLWYGTRIDGMGDLVIFMQKPIGIMIFVGVPVVLFIVYDIIRRRLHEDERRAVPISQQSANADLEAEVERLRAELEKTQAGEVPQEQAESSATDNANEPTTKEVND